MDSKAQIEAALLSGNVSNGPTNPVESFPTYFRITAARKYAVNNTLNNSFEKLNLNENGNEYIYCSETSDQLFSNSDCSKIPFNSNYNLNITSINHSDYTSKKYLTIFDITRYASQFPFMTPKSSVRDDKSKDFIDDATMEYVRHNLFKLSCIEGMVTSGPPAAITFRSTVTARRKSNGKVSLLLHWSPENMIPDNWVAEDELISNLEKTIPISQLPHEALQLPVLDAFGSAGILSPPGKRKRK